MDQFDDARIRAEKMEAKRVRYKPMTEETMALRQPLDIPTLEGTLHLPKPPKVKPPKAPVKRTNEIGITIYVSGEVIELTARVNLNDIIASQRNRKGLATLLRDALAVKFGKVEIT